MSKIVSVHSFRGGAGKSNLVANLAVIIARQGRRVGIIDTDIQSPHVLFGLDEEKIGRTLNDYLLGRCPIEDTAYDVEHTLKMRQGGVDLMGGNIYIIPSSLKSEEITRVLHDGYEAGRLVDGFRELVQRLELAYLLIDTHPGLNEESLLSIAISDVMIIILRIDHQDYQGTAIMADVARKMNVPRALLVVNEALSTYDFDAIRQQMERIYNVPVAGILPLCKDLLRLGSSDIFCLRYPDHPFTQELRKIAAQVTAPEPGEA